MILAAVDGQWAIGGGLGAVALIAFIRWMLSDNSQVLLLRSEVNELRERQASLESEINEQRTLKHAISGDMARAVMALEVVRRMAQNCTCNALEPVEQIVDQLLNELSTIRAARQQRRVDD